jgi:hypothetical protein
VIEYRRLLDGTHAVNQQVSRPLVTLITARFFHAGQCNLCLNSRGEVLVATLRRALLDPRFGSIYPEIPAGHWLPAWQAAMRRAERLWRDVGPDALIEGRLLPDEHFKFRGGKPRELGWYVEPQRLSDPGERPGTDQ